MSDQQAGSGTVSPAGIPWAAPVVRVLVRDVVLPYLAYVVLHTAGVANVWALAGGAAVSLAMVVLDAARSRHVNALGLIVLVTLVLAVVVSLISGNARVTLARDCVITGGLGLIFLGSLVRGRPLVYHVLARFDAARGPSGQGRLAERWQNDPQVRSSLRITTLVWGLVLLADATLRLIAVLVLPVPEAAAMATVLTILTVVVLVGFLRFYLPRHAREATAGTPA